MFVASAGYKSFMESLRDSEVSCSNTPSLVRHVYFSVDGLFYWRNQCDDCRQTLAPPHSSPRPPRRGATGTRAKAKRLIITTVKLDEKSCYSILIHI